MIATALLFPAKESCGFCKLEARNTRCPYMFRNTQPLNIFVCAWFIIIVYVNYTRIDSAVQHLYRMTSYWRRMTLRSFIRSSLVVSFCLQLALHRMLWMDEHDGCPLSVLASLSWMVLPWICMNCRYWVLSSVSQFLYLVADSLEYLKLARESMLHKLMQCTKRNISFQWSRKDK